MNQAKEARLRAAGFSGPWPAPVKLNLFLHVNGRRLDGFHDLQTFFRLLDFGDCLYFRPRSDGVIRRVDQALPDLDPAQDLIIRAARVLRDQLGNDRLGADIHLVKRTPVGGGLGGGSSDAATTLRVLDRLWSANQPLTSLESLGLQLGSDVPVFVRGRSGWAEGRGERLIPDDRPDDYYLVVCPGHGVSTAELFSAPELERNAPRLSLAPPPTNMPQTNAFMPVLLARSDAVRAACQSMETLGLTPRLTGTGACLFARFSERRDAEQAATALPGTLAHYVAAGCNRSPLLDQLEQARRAS
ncbi:MAG: 4-(cytidine 5'-diphospho)-2-C-methyl-D-erythritol kinase [Halothiobacillaceae bacterium]